DIGDEAQRRRRDHHRHDRESIEAVGQIDGVAEGDNHERAEQQEAPAEIEDKAVDERQSERSRAVGADPHHRITGERGDDIFAEQARAAGEAEMRLLRHLQIIVIEADRGEAHGDEQHDPHIGAFQVGPQQSRDEEAEQDHEAAHGRRALLAQNMRGRSVDADRLTLALFQPQRGNDRRTEEEDEKKPGSRGAKRAKREVAEQMERARQMGQLGEPRQHRTPSSFAAPAKWSRSAATSRPIRLPLEPLIIAMSPPRKARATSLVNSCDWRAQTARMEAGAASNSARVSGPAPNRRSTLLALRSAASSACMASPFQPSSSMSPMIAIRRPFGPGFAAASRASAAR